MGCLGCKHSETINETHPHISWTESQWRCVLGIEVKGLEFNAQFGLVYSSNRNLQITNHSDTNLNVITKMEE